MSVFAAVCHSSPFEHLNNESNKNNAFSLTQVKTFTCRMNCKQNNDMLDKQNYCSNSCANNYSP